MMPLRGLLMLVFLCSIHCITADFLDKHIEKVNNFLNGKKVQDLKSLTADVLEKQIAKANIYFHGKKLREVKSLPTKSNIKVVVHGYMSSGTSGSVVSLTKAFLEHGYPSTLVCDWREAAMLLYPTSRSAVSKVAKLFGKILQEFFKRLDIPLNNVHVIGHSLGAHIAGNIGRYFDGKLNRVTGLDPALPLFTKSSSDGLRSEDAPFVDVIHTDYPVFGDLTRRGTADFYPNFGTTQPGCDKSVKSKVMDILACSHSRAVELYVETIKHPKTLPASPCDMKCIINENKKCCSKNSTIVYMGEHVSREASGSYYLTTRGSPQFG